MNKFFSLVIVALALVSVSCSQESFKINVAFDDHSFDGKNVYLTNYDSGDTIDSATVNEKAVVIEGKLDSAFYARLIVDGKRFGMIVEPGEINVTWGENKVATGSPLNAKLNGINKKFDEIDSKWDEISQALSEGKITEDEASKQNADLEKQQMDELYKVYQENKDNALGPWAFTNYLIYRQFNPAQLDSILQTAPENYRGFVRVKKAMSDAKAIENTAVGKEIVDFDVKTPEGKVEKFSTLVTGDGNYTVVDFWASWCGPCRKEINGALKQIHNKYNGNGVKVLGVAVWDNPEDTKAAIEQMAIPWHVMVGDHYMKEQTDLYGIAGIPHIMVVDPKGIILSRGLQGDALVTFVDNLMKKH